MDAAIVITTAIAITDGRKDRRTRTAATCPEIRTAGNRASSLRPAGRQRRNDTQARYFAARLRVIPTRNRAISPLSRMAPRLS